MRIILFLFICSFVYGFDLNSLHVNLKADKIEGNFTQTKIIKDFPLPFKSSGTFKIVKSKKLIWSSLKPVRERIKIDENGLFILDENNTWIKSKQDINKGVFLDLLSLNEKSLNKMFTSELSGDMSSWSLLLKPKENLLKQIFDNIKLSGDEVIRELNINEKRGDKSIVKFENIKKIE